MNGIRALHEDHGEFIKMRRRRRTSENSEKLFNMPPPQAVNFKTIITSTAYSWGLIVPPLRAQGEMSISKLQATAVWGWR